MCFWFYTGHGPFDSKAALQDAAGGREDRRNRGLQSDQVFQEEGRSGRQGPLHDEGPQDCPWARRG